MRFNLRVALVSLIALVAIGSIWSINTVPPEANKSENTSDQANASDSKIVTLVVDFGNDSGLKVKSFDITDIPNKSSGWDLFALAPVQVEGTQQFSKGFVCRINGWPKATDQDCMDTPTFDEGHWAYYVTNREIGPGWILSGQGAATHTPDCGGYEGWSWVPGGAETKPPRFDLATRACK